MVQGRQTCPPFRKDSRTTDEDTWSDLSAIFLRLCNSAYILGPGRSTFSLSAGGMTLKISSFSRTLRGRPATGRLHPPARCSVGPGTTNGPSPRALHRTQASRFVGPTGEFEVPRFQTELSGRVVCEAETALVPLQIGCISTSPSYGATPPLLRQHE